jgi:hypothetical protein
MKTRAFSRSTLALDPKCKLAFSLCRPETQARTSSKTGSPSQWELALFRDFNVRMGYANHQGTTAAANR